MGCRPFHKLWADTATGKRTRCKNKVCARENRTSVCDLDTKEETLTRADATYPLKCGATNSGSVVLNLSLHPFADPLAPKGNESLSDGLADDGLPKFVPRDSLVGVGGVGSVGSKDGVLKPRDSRLREANVHSNKEVFLGFQDMEELSGIK